MPRGDRTGPLGQGPMTGRAAGYCAGYPVPGYMNPVPRYGRGYGRGPGRGYGRGFRRGYGRGRGHTPRFSYPAPRQNPPQQYGYQAYANPSPAYPTTRSPEQDMTELQQYKEALKNDKANLEQELKQVEDRIEELKAIVEQRREQPTGP